MQLLKTVLQLKEIVFAAIVLISLALGAFISGRLSPINKSVNTLNLKVEAIEKDNEQNCEDHRLLKEGLVEIKEDVSFIRGYLENN